MVRETTTGPRVGQGPAHVRWLEVTTTAVQEGASHSSERALRTQGRAWLQCEMLHDRTSCSPGWLLTGFVAKDDVQPLIFVRHHIWFTPDRCFTIKPYLKPNKY